MPNLKLNIISSGQVRVEKISLLFLETLIEPLRNSNVKINWYGTFWDDELMIPSKLKLLEEAGCNFELIKPLDQELINEWSTKINPMPDCDLRSNISQYYCKNASFERANKLIGTSCKTELYMYFRTDSIFVVPFLRFKGKREYNFKGLQFYIDQIKDKTEPTLVGLEPIDPNRKWPTDQKILLADDIFGLGNHGGMSSFLSIYKNLVAFAPYSSTEDGKVTKEKIFMPEIITHNSIVLNKVKYIKIEQSMPLPVVDGFPLKPWIAK